MIPTEFKVITDEHIANAVQEQLASKGVNAVRLIDILPEGTSDPEVLEFAHQNGYVLVTLDKNMMKHITNRIDDDKEHSGVFIGINLHGKEQIGIVSTLFLCIMKL